tara:strand:- start:990 stop:2285 length:1296 start_codon:yes stop_codon:yes gene_type:complete
MKSKTVSISYLFIAITLFFVTTNINWGKDDWKGALESDAKGYYAYLPAVFIYQDLNFAFLDKIEQKYDQQHIYYEYRSNAHGVLINKYYAGVSVLQLPFFAGAHALTVITGGDADGYSKYYMLAISVSSWFYHLVGLYFMIQLFQYFKIKPKTIALLLFVISFGTNLFVYTIVEAGMSHVYSFAMVSAFLYFAYKAFVLGLHRYLLWSSFLLGLIVLCRPINALIVLFIPFLFPRVNDFLKSLSSAVNKWKSILQLVLPILIIVCIQLIYYKLATGHFLVYSYDEEGFNFANPEWFNFLFRYKKGLFLYTPLYLIGVSSLLFVKQLSGFQKSVWFIAMGIVIYVFSSWWMWFYGGSFSARVMVEFIPLFMLPLALLLNQLTGARRAALSIVVVLLIGLCQIQSYQYRYYEIHYSEMTQEKYWEVFLLRNRF